jgi:hypothetical protein
MIGTYILTTVIAIFGGLIFVYICINLIGMVIRGVYTDFNLTNVKNDKTLHEYVRGEAQKAIKLNHFSSLVFIVLTILFYFLLFKFFGLLALIAGALVMVGRLPDLLWEIKHGRNVKQENKGFNYYFTALSIPVALVLLWIVAYHTLT